MTTSNRTLQALIITVSLCILSAVTMTACTGKESAGHDNTSEEAVHTKEADDTETEQVQQDTPPQSDTAEFSYDDLKNTEFYFSSGAGAWSTTLQIEADGSFFGVYHDSDMGSTGEGYPGGTCYVSVFSGQFDTLKKVNDYTYSTTIKKLELENEPDTEEIKDEIKYIYSKPYGISDADELFFYVKGAPVSELPESFLSWVMYGDTSQTTLPFYGLYNAAEKNGFSSSEYPNEDSPADTSSIREDLNALETKAQELEARMENENLTQQEYNELSAELYSLWDNKLNEIWGYLKDSLDETSMAQLTEEEREWIREKEDAVKEAAAEYENGTMQSMTENLKGAQLTRERVYELAEMLLQ